MNHVKCYIKDYPRPMLVRQKWQPLDGEWNFLESDREEFYVKGFETEQKIRVPFAPESPMSGLGRRIKKPCIWYSRNVDIKKDNGRIHLVFEGCDHDTQVYVNGHYTGSHSGAYTRFSFDITQWAKNGKNTIAVRVEDSDSCELPRGKQSWKDSIYSCFYVPTTGIYKPVWLDFSGDSYLEQVKLTPDALNSTLGIKPAVVSDDTTGLTLLTVVSFQGKTVASCEIGVTGSEEVTLSVFDKERKFSPNYWSAETPNLYDLEFYLKKNGAVVDSAGSYFGLRDATTDGPRFMVNNKPVYLRLLLDQGYWSKSHLTPPDEQALIHDIMMTKQMGYNGVRKHQKTEDERYLYYADILGLYVWCEMPSAYEFSDRMVGLVSQEWQKIVRQYYNFTSIITWVPLNESWGVSAIARNKTQQNFAEMLYYLTKSIDPKRPVVSNDGWQHAKTDILTIHHYTQYADRLKGYYADLASTVSGSVKNPQLLPFADGYRYEGQPILFSEFGGTAFVDGNSENWGYGQAVRSEEEFLQRFGALTDAIREMDYVCGYCYTQLTDVQQEVNGLLDADHQPKIDPAKIAAITTKW